MNDPIKKFVQENREAFDHLDPSAEVLQRIKAQLKPAPIAKKGILRRLGINKWFIAASIYLGLVMAYILWDNREEPVKQQIKLVEQPVQQQEKKAAKTGSKQVSTVETPLIADKETSLKKKTRFRKIEHHATWPETIHRQLTDSNSASLRLAAVLEMDKKTDLDNELLIMLSRTMNHDGNSNVRVAALDVLGKHLQNPNVANILIKSLAKQDDPLVQLGLINVLEKVDNKEIDQTLFGLTNNPNTFAAVKDEAYTVLLNQNKL